MQNKKRPKTQIIENFEKYIKVHWIQKIEIPNKIK